MIARALGVTAFGEPPLEPDADEAVSWIISELSDPSYAASEPTLIDRIAEAINDWFRSLIEGAGAAPGWLLAVIIGGLVVAGIIVALLVYGVPRFSRRRRAAADGALFGDGDLRTAAELRLAASSAASAGDWTTAVAERFRAVARGLTEREAVAISPGTTATEFARRTAEVFPDLAGQLPLAAAHFDEVRYLMHPGSAQQYAQVAALDDALVAARPAVAVEVVS